MQRTYPERLFTTSVLGEEIFARAWTADATPRRRAIVMVHGIAVSSRYMVPLARRLAADADVYAIDLPGFGRSTKPRRAWPMEQLGDALGSWIAANVPHAPILLGNSNGCQVIASLVARRPELASALVLNSPTVDDAHRTMLAEIGRLILDIPRESWPLITLNARDYLRAGARRSLETLRFAIADRIEDNLAHTQMPILIVRGSRDPIVSDRWVRRLASVAPNASCVTLDGAPHAANFSAADAFASAVRAFLVRSTHVSAESSPYS